MPRYDVKCPEGHYFEVFQALSEFKREHECACGREGQIVITSPPQFNVDNVDRVDYTVSAGQNFTNRRERDNWLKAHNAHIMGDDSVSREMMARRSELVEEMREVESRGGNWKQHLAEKSAAEQAAKEARMKAAGVSVQALTKEEQAAVQWEDTVQEADFMSPTLHGTAADGTRWAKMALPKERVPEPFFD